MKVLYQKYCKENKGVDRKKRMDKSKLMELVKMFDGKEKVIGKQRELRKRWDRDGVEREEEGDDIQLDYVNDSYQMDQLGYSRYSGEQN